MEVMVLQEVRERLDQLDQPEVKEYRVKLDQLAITEFKESKAQLGTTV